MTIRKFSIVIFTLATISLAIKTSGLKLRHISAPDDFLGHYLQQSVNQDLADINLLEHLAEPSHNTGNNSNSLVRDHRLKPEVSGALGINHNGRKLNLQQNFDNGFISGGLESEQDDILNQESFDSNINSQSGHSRSGTRRHQPANRQDARPRWQKAG